MAKLVPMPEGYSIDATEVTRDQYAAWLAGNPTTTGQDTRCTLNNSYTPSCEWPAGTKGDHPVVCVDWCDAYAYCAGVGKRLCGGIGGGMSGYSLQENASTSQWSVACTSGGTNDYPYGDTYSGTTCNAYEAGHGTTVPVASMSGCQSSSSGYTGVYDLSGNVFEWEDSSMSDVCRIRGGYFSGSDSYNDGHLNCFANFDYGGFNRSSSYDYIGFRCCSDP
jgi:formylglycine-generating enzyme required for sulfatase activity